MLGDNTIFYFKDVVRFMVIHTYPKAGAESVHEIEATLEACGEMCHMVFTKTSQTRSLIQKEMLLTVNEFKFFAQMVT